MVKRWQIFYAILFLAPVGFYLSFYFSQPDRQTIEEREALFLQTCDAVLQLESPGCQQFLDSYGDFMRR